MYVHILVLLIVMQSIAYAQSSTDDRSIRPWSMLYPSAETIHVDNDLPVVFSNDVTRPLHIRAVSCYIRGNGRVVINPVLTGKAANSVLKQPLVCDKDDGWKSGAVNGTPVVNSFSYNAATCNIAPCTIDLNIVSVDGDPHYMIIKIIPRVPR
jgi:hypothetical protein